MAITKTPQQPGKYLKVEPRSLIQQTEGSILTGQVDENGTPLPDTKLPDTIKFIVGATLYNSEADRLAAKTDEWVRRQNLSFEFNFVPELPEGWVPIDPANIESEKIIARGYLAIKTLPEYGDWVDYQP
jgi:hypothetical protein